MGSSMAYLKDWIPKMLASRRSYGFVVVRVSCSIWV